MTPATWPSIPLPFSTKLPGSEKVSEKEDKDDEKVSDKDDGDDTE